MRKFTGLEYIQLDLANQFGLDKLSWNERFQWFYHNETKLDSIIEIAKEPILFYKALLTYRRVMNDEPTGYMIGLDATASGLQIMAALSGCFITAANVNLVNTEKREDVYQYIADKMSKIAKIVFDRNTVKKPIMTTFYGSSKQPGKVFGEDSDNLSLFYDTLIETCPGAVDCLNYIQSAWQENTYEHSWVLPDQHVVHVKVIQAVDKKIEVDELNHSTFTHRLYKNIPCENGLSLAANVIHSIDGYIVREMYRMAAVQGFDLATIHDSFWCSPNYMNNVRENYITILADIASSDLLNEILTSITGKPSNIRKIDQDLESSILKSEYALS